MTRLVEARLVNGPFADPGLFIDVRFGRRALLFDCGDLAALSARELLRVSHVFVSHAHMDHFRGFDTLLGLCLYRPGPLHLVGPLGFADRVAAKLAAYTWNLLDETSPDFALVVDEFVEGAVRQRARFAAREAFARRDAEPPGLRQPLVLEEDDFLIEAETFDHGTPSLAFALQEKLRVNVRRNDLDRMGLPVGRWLNDAKRAVRRGDPDQTAVAVDATRQITLGELRAGAFAIAPGDRIVYLVDTAPTPDNIARAVAFVRGASTLFVEAAFADQDAGLAARRLHLTATLAGRIARDGGVRRVVPLHFSPRYADTPDLIPKQVEAAFRPAIPES